MQTREYVTILCDQEIPPIEENEIYSKYKSKIDKTLFANRFPIYAFQTGKWLIIRFFVGSLIYDTKSQTGLYKSNMQSNITSDTFPFEHEVVGKGNDGSIITSMDATSFLRRINDGSENMKFRPSQELINSIDEESNPVLIRYKFKE